MHVITAGTTEVHIDVHQPVESKEESWPWMTVQKYAALGGMVDQWEGYQQMLKDTPTMERLKAAEELIREVDLAQFDRRPYEMPVGP